MFRSTRSLMMCVMFVLGMFSAGAVAAEPTDVVAKVNGEDILQQDVDQIIDVFVLPQFQAQNPGAELPAEQRTQIEKNIVEQLVTERVLIQKATEDGISADEALVNERFEQAKTQRPDLSDEMLRGLLEKDNMIQTLLENAVISKISVTDEEAQAYYDEQQEQFQEPEQIQASHILIQVAQDAGDEAKQTARQKIDEVLVLAKEGQDFAELAKEYSEGPSKDQGGDLGFFPKGAMVPAFEEAAFALEIDEISEVVETQFGYHIIKLVAKKEARSVPFDEVKEQLKQVVQQQKTGTEVKAWVEALKAEADVEIM